MVDIQIYLRNDDVSNDESRAAEVAKMEAKQSKTLPKEYRKFLVDYGGGFLWPRDIVIQTDALRDYIGDEIVGIFEFYDPETVAEYSDGGVFRDATPESFLFVADANGVQILLSLRDPDFGSLYVWRPTGIKWGSEGNDNSTVVFLSENFQTLISQLTDFRGEGVGRNNWEAGGRRFEARTIKL